MKFVRSLATGWSPSSSRHGLYLVLNADNPSSFLQIAFGRAQLLRVSFHSRLSFKAYIMPIMHITY